MRAEESSVQVEQKELMPLCPFAKAVFDQEPQFGDVRA